MNEQNETWNKSKMLVNEFISIEQLDLLSVDVRVKPFVFPSVEEAMVFLLIGMLLALRAMTERVSQIWKNMHLGFLLFLADGHVL